MSWAVYSPKDARAARLPNSPGHASFPSISESSDSQSVHSHAYFSPPRPDEIEPNYDVHPVSYTERPSSRTRRHRLSDPTASSLDLDDDYAAGSSLNSADTTGDVENEDEGEDSSHRISIQGPKIRFHSRAPWEIGEDTINEDESDHSGKSGMFGRKAKTKTAEAGLMRHFGRGSSRPSADSNRSHAQSKAPFETTTRRSHSISRGAL